LQTQEIALNRQIFELKHTEAEIRAADIAAMPESLQGLQAHVYALKDEAKAATDAAATEKSLQEQRAVIDRQIFELSHTEAEIRAADIAAMPESLQGLQAHVYALKDEAKAATDAAATAATAAQEKYTLETQLLTLQGDTAALRLRELSLTEEGNRTIKEQIWAIQDAQALAATQVNTVTTLTSAVSEQVAVTDNLASAAKDASSALDSITQSLDDLQKYRDALWSSNATTALSGKGLLVSQQSVVADLVQQSLSQDLNIRSNALSGLSGSVSAYLSTARLLAVDSLDYARQLSKESALLGSVSESQDATLSDVRQAIIDLNKIIADNNKASAETARQVDDIISVLRDWQINGMGVVTV
jgi:hypothetical protein